MMEEQVISCGVVFTPKEPTEEDKEFMDKLYKAFGIEVDSESD